MSAARAGLLAGSIAGVAMVGATIALRVATQVVSLPEVLAEWILAVTPPEIFSAILDTLKFSAKPMLFGGIALGAALMGGLLGRYWATRTPNPRSAALLVGLVWLGTVLLALPLFGAGFFGSALLDGALAVSGTILATYTLYGAVLVLSYNRFARDPATLDSDTEDEPRSPVRRVVLRRLGVGIAAMAVAGVGLRALVALRPTQEGAPGEALPSDTLVSASQPPTPANATSKTDPFVFGDMPAEVTPTEKFYRVSKNIFDPSVDARSWRLEVVGKVDRPLVLTYDDLKGLPAVQNFYTLECISNEVGGDLIGNAHWRGVRLQDLLEQAGVQQGVLDVVFHAADGYADSIPLELGLFPDTVVAYEMNGRPLTREHGFPARLLIPGIFGMKNVKWVTKVELVPENFQGFWQQRGWSDVATYQTMSRFDEPRRGATVSVAGTRIGGVAFAGDRGIVRVEVSADGGATWTETDLKPAVSPYTWRLWAYTWTPSQSGDQTLLVRATDGKGNVQTVASRPPLPDGATGYHRINVGVA